MLVEATQPHATCCPLAIELRPRDTCQARILCTRLSRVARHCATRNTAQGVRSTISHTTQIQGGIYQHAHVSRANKRELERLTYPPGTFQNPKLRPTSDARLKIFPDAPLQQFSSACLHLVQECDSIYKHIRTQRGANQYVITRQHIHRRQDHMSSQNLPLPIHVMRVLLALKEHWSSTTGSLQEIKGIPGHVAPLGQA